MRLSKVHVTNYKSVLDSNWFTVDDLTCLVGKNESGKAALLEALEKLNSVDPKRTDYNLTEYPRMNWSEYEESGQVAIALETEWLLDDKEIEFINSSTPEPALKSTVIRISKDYSNKVKWDVQLDYGKAVTSLLNSSGLDDEDKKKLGAPNTTTDLIKALRDLEENATPRHKTFLIELEARFPEGSLMQHTIAYLQKRLPNLSTTHIMMSYQAVYQLIN